MALTAKINDQTKRAFKQIGGLTQNSLVDYIDSFVEVAREGSPIDTGNNRSSIAAAGSHVGSVKIIVDGDADNKSGANFSGTPVPPGLKKGIFWVFTRSKYGGLLELFHTPYMHNAAITVNKEFDDDRKWGT